MDPKYLLTDDQMAHFITDGYIVLRNDLPERLHQSILEQVDAVIAKEGNPGNNILPRVPEIQQLFDTPTVRGALTSILGQDYEMHPHRHCHFNAPGTREQGLHKDGYWSAMRSHRPWWAIVFYYTQDVTEDMGPTGIMPGTHYYETKVGDEKQQLVMPAGKAGTMVLVHFDLWHKATLNRTQIKRYMLKFQFVRTREPEFPSWNNQRSMWIPPEPMTAVHTDHHVVWENIWNWLRGEKKANDTIEQRSADSVPKGAAVSDLKSSLGAPFEPEVINAAYALAREGAAGVNTLLNVLRDGSQSAAYQAAYGLAAAGGVATVGLIEALRIADDERRGLACFSLGQLGSDAVTAVPALSELALGDSSPWVRRNAVEALGMIRKPVERVSATLIETLGDSEQGDLPMPDTQPYIHHKVRYTAALSLMRIAAESEGAAVIHALSQALEDGDRYVRAYASLALACIRSDDAMTALLHHLQTSRWCSLTTSSSMY